MSRKDQLLESAARFHLEHPEVWRLFVRFTFDLIAAGRDHSSAKAIWERLRWETAVNPGAFNQGELKLNNNYHAFYARRFASRYPSHATFFRFRRQRSESAPERRTPPAIDPYVRPDEDRHAP